MTKKQFTLANNVSGWLTFLIAAVVYILTIEPTASFWDCGEFITTSYKLEVGHPPGAPFFMILGRFFSLFAFGDVTLVAKMINIMSALASAFTILFLFWSIVHIAKKILLKNNEYATDKVIATLGSAFVGALAYTFSDTFWFSAVEGEVYATSSLFTAIVFWAILKWENEADQKYSNRWLILIAYLMGLSIGVHLLNLLAIPAIVFVYYFKKYKTTTQGIVYASLVAVTLLGVIMYGVIPWVVKMASGFEYVFVNWFGLPFNTGAIFYSLLLIGLIIFGLYYTYINKKTLANTIILAFTVILIGYSSFTMIVIRSFANPPMDQNSPENVFSLLTYLNREQYGDRPLVYGQYYNAPVTNYEEGAPTYTKKDGKYVVTDRKLIREFDSRFETIFPRMYSDQSAPNHPKGYSQWTGVTPDQTEPPTFGQNLVFFFKYQVGFMYLRYFMWNFAGRQNDIQGNGDPMNGNWISGIPFIDNMRLGDQGKLPDHYKNNKGRNAYYFLPLILGIFGMIFLYKEKKEEFWVVMLLFLFTGMAIVVYLNQPPYQPRERDYAYAASFYAFAIYIGFGVAGLYKYLKEVIPAQSGAILATAGSFLLVPLLMGFQNWDDHDRSGRYTARDFAKNYLNSCEENAILFTNGDNDTFPLWYAQEVEGIRTDIRVINLSYLNTDWYIDQMKRRAYLSAPVPFSMGIEQYRQGKRDIVYIVEKINKPYSIKELIKFVASDDPQKKLPQQDGEMADYLPTKKFSLKVDSAKVVDNGTVKPKSAHLIESEMQWDARSSYVRKNELMVLDLLANFEWERPIYFAVTVGPGSYMNLQKYFQLDGLAYRVVPIKTESKYGETGRVDTDVLYENMMNKFVWGNITDPDVYLDENNQRMLMNIKSNFVRLADALVAEGKKDSAIQVLDHCEELMPNERVPYNYYNILLANSYFMAGAKEKAIEMIKTYSESLFEEIDYYLSLDEAKVSWLADDKDRAMAFLGEIFNRAQMYGDDDFFNELNTKIELLFSKYPNSLKQ